MTIFARPMSSLRVQSALDPVFLLIVCLIFISCGGNRDSEINYDFTETIRSTPPRTPSDERAGFVLPDGFEIELFASEPQIGKPINLNFDARGRLWVTQSSFYPVPASNGNGTDKITILEDTDNDGRADTFIDFVDTLNVPIGVLPTPSGAIAFSIPNIYKFVDADSDGKADHAKAVIGQFGYVDTHGMVSNFIRGYDGWIHACHGFTNQSTIAGANGDSITLVSGNTFRFTSDAERVEQTTFGQVNPFGLVYDEFGYLYSTDSHSSPLYQLIDGGNYPHFGKEELMAFGPDMKSFEEEATALCGITQYADTKFPKEFQNNFFIGDAVKSVVHRYSAEFKGSSPVGKSERDFILSADPWFRPVNIKLGPDGALYVADFYNAIIGHYEVPLGHPKRDKSRGRIWRITFKGNQHDRKDLSVAKGDELLTALDDDNLPMRMEAMHQLVDRIGMPGVSALRGALHDKATTPRKYVHLLWALQRLNSLSAEDIQASSRHSSALVRLHTLRVIREMTSTIEENYSIIIQSLNDADPHVRRAAIEVLPYSPSIESLRAALTSASRVQESDTHARYTIQLVVRNMLRDDAVLAEVIRREWTESEERLIAMALLEVNSASSALFLSRFLSKHSLGDKKTPLAYRQMVSMLPSSLLASEIQKAMDRYAQDIELSTIIFKNLQRGLEQRAVGASENLLQPQATRLAKRLFSAYPVTDSLPAKNALAYQVFAVQLVGDYGILHLENELKSLFRSHSSQKEDVQLRSAAFRSLVKLSDKNLDLAGPILTADNESLEFRKEIAKVLGEFPGKRVSAILAQVENAPPALQPALVTSMASTKAGKDIIFRRVRQGKIQARILVEPQIEERIFLNITPEQEQEYKDLVSNLQPVSAEKDALIKDRIASFGSFTHTSDILDSGRIIFNRYCGACHRRANQIGIGPQLHGIGKRGPEAIIEKILDPNRNISVAFQNYTIRLKDGKVLVGLYRREEGESLVFADMTGKEFTIAKKDVETKEASKYTLMPDNFSESIPPKDFNTLISYLLTW